MIRILLADDQALVRTGFALMLDLEDDLEVVAQAADGAAAVDGVVTHHPDVVLMDVRMPGMDGIEATRRIAASGVRSRVIILTTYDADSYVYEALQAGAAGFLLKDAPREQLVAAIRMVLDGDALLAPAITRRLVERFAARPALREGATPPELAALSAREVEVLRHVARGASNREIAEALFLSVATVKTHVAAVLAKLGVRDRVQAVVTAYEVGLVQPGGGGAGPAR